MAAALVLALSACHPGPVPAAYPDIEAELLCGGRFSGGYGWVNGERAPVCDVP